MSRQTVKKENVGFDDFLIKKWGNASEPDYEKKRRGACRQFRKKIKGKNVAAAATVNLWFGIGGKSQPNREKMFCLAFALELSGEEMTDYLKRGLLMPGIQANDYMELIYFYGLEHELSYQECQQMIEAFELYMCKDLVVEQRTHTVKLWEYYGKWRQLDKVHFLKEMCGCAGMFKGYSRTALKYFLSLKKEILHIVSAEAKYHLEDCLKRAGYDEWLQEQGIRDGESKELIYRYLKNLGRHENIKKDRNMLALIKEIRSDCQIVFASQERNVHLLRELYSSAINVNFHGKGKNLSYMPRKEYDFPINIRFMSEDYLSNLLSVAVQREKQIRLAHACAWSRQHKAEEECPAWLQDMIQEYHGDKVNNIGQAWKQLVKLLERQTKRCLLIQREDLLVLIHCLVQKKYMSLYGENQKTYRPDEAKRNFEETAGCILVDCDMEALNEKYSLDRLLMESFRREGIESFADIIDRRRR